MDAQRKNIFARFFDAGGGALVLIFVGAIMAWIGVGELRLSNASVASTCTVLETSTRKGKRDADIVPQVRLAHEVGGRRYERLDEGVQGSQEEATRALAAFPKGGTVRCHYVEGKPELVVVFHERKGGVILGVGIGLIVVAAGAHFVSRKKG
jgi:hypothetical protein